MRNTEIRDPNQVAAVPGIERMYSDWSELPTQQIQDSEMSAEQTLESLKAATDELTGANLKAQSLLTEFGLVCENAEMDGLAPPNKLTAEERKQLRSALISAREALRYLTELEARHD